eukprot:gb/GFBE01075219.1/.p1 GENE.gb/GFBE01075219.1/~~gb/GFBE01075219.1/.p1  ORF type:complete len:111 (+),score=11.43 gb/GFBE01075219.1/:1-333(+)
MPNSQCAGTESEATASTASIESFDAGAPELLGNRALGRTSSTISTMSTDWSRRYNAPGGMPECPDDSSESLEVLAETAAIDWDSIDRAHVMDLCPVEPKEDGLGEIVVRV